MVPDWNVSWSAARRRHWTEIKIEIYGFMIYFYDIILFFLFILVIDNVLKQHLNIFDTGQHKLSSTAATVWCYIFELFKYQIPNSKKIKVNTEDSVTVSEIFMVKKIVGNIQGQIVTCLPRLSET